LILDWKSLPNGQEKRLAYMASREWALKREAVRQRSRGRCEHCRVAAATQTHHQTYRRLYAERLEDLLHVCEPCHLFLSGKGGKNPAVRISRPDPDVEELCPTGVHPAVFIAIVHLGTHDGLAKLALFFELTSVKRDGGLGHVIPVVFDLETDQGCLLWGSQSQRFIEDWRGYRFSSGEDVDPSKWLAAPCLVNVVDDRDWPVLANVIPMPEGVPTPKVCHACFAGSTLNPDDAWLGYLPDVDGEPIAEIMARSEELMSSRKPEFAGSPVPF
jgi:hypothetical protein